jgi:hypothetical protein
MPLSTGARLGPYEILSPLGAGGMGEVPDDRRYQEQNNTEYGKITGRSEPRSFRASMKVSF